MTSNKMRVFVSLLLPLLACCAPAVLVKDVPLADESMKPLIRTKRADEEILFGNHQNEARIFKKTDPSQKLLNANDATEKMSDGKTNAQTDDVTGNKYVTATNDDVNELFSDDAKSIGDLSEDEEINELPEFYESTENSDGEDEDFTENDGESLQTDDISTEADDTSTEADDILSDNEGEQSGEDQEGQTTDTISSKDDYYDYFYPKTGLGRFRRSEMTKRSADANLLTAESMADMSTLKTRPFTQRFKRDLTADDISDWLENGAAELSDEGYKLQDYIPEYEDEESAPETPWDNLALERLLTGDYPNEDSSDLPGYPDYADSEAETDPELLSLLEYLVENENVKQGGNDLGDIYPERIEERWEDLDLEPKTEYEPIVYEGVPGIFIPTYDRMQGQGYPIQKRQYMSMVPGVRKRSDQDFYPYGLEPEGGRWGAFTGPDDEKRTADAYERLYRLAEALNADNRDFKK